MKKTAWIAAACAAGYACGYAGAAHAQSSVALYGLIDSGLLYTSNAGGHAAWQAASGDVTGSHWGLVGSENLGGGTRAIFEIENGFGATNGSLRQGGREFGYQSYVGLSSARLGALTLGRQYDSVVDYVAPLSFTGVHPGGNNLSAHPFDNDNLNNSFRVNNALKYASPSWSGLRFGGLYAFSDEAGGFADNRLYSVGAAYDNGPLSVAAGWLEANNGGSANTNGALTLTDRSFIAARQRTWGAGVRYALGDASFGVVWTRSQFGGVTTINGANSLALAWNGQGVAFTNVELNARYRFTPAFSVTGSYTYTAGTLSNASGAHRPHWNEVSVMADYFLSKRTDLYAQASYQQIASDGSGLGADISGQAMSAADRQAAVGVGIRHRF